MRKHNQRHHHHHQHNTTTTSVSSTTATTTTESETTTTLTPASYIINSKELTTMIKGIDTRYQQVPPTRSSPSNNNSRTSHSGTRSNQLPEPIETSMDVDRPSKPRRLARTPPPTTITSSTTTTSNNASSRNSGGKQHQKQQQQQQQKFQKNGGGRGASPPTATTTSLSAAAHQKIKNGRSKGSMSTTSSRNKSRSSPQPYHSHDYDDEDESSIDDHNHNEEQQDDTMIISPTYTTYTTADGTHNTDGDALTETEEYNTESSDQYNTDYDSLYDDLSVEESSTYSSSCKGLSTPTPTFDMKKELGINLGLLGLGRQEEVEEDLEEEDNEGVVGGGNQHRHCSKQGGDQRIKTSPYDSHHEEKKEQQLEDTKVHIIEDVPDDDVTAFTKEKEEASSNHNNHKAAAESVAVALTPNSTDSPSTPTAAFSSSTDDGSSPSGGTTLDSSPTTYHNNNNPNNISMTSTQSTSQYNLLYRLKTNDSSLTHLHLDPEVLKRAGGATNIVNAIFFDDGNVSRNGQFLSELTISDLEADYSEAEESFMILCRIIAKGPNLHTLNLVNCQFDRHLANMLGLALSKKAALIRQNMVPGYSPTPISRLAICQCNFERATCAMAVIFMGISHLYNQLQHLTIEMNDYVNGGFIPDVVFGAMPLLKLHSLTLINTKLTANDLEFLYPNLEATASTLKELNLSRTHVIGKDPFCLKNLLECVIAPNSNIEKLTLQDCNFSYETMKLFPYVLGTKLSLITTPASEEHQPSSSSSSVSLTAGSTTSAFLLVSPPSCTQPDLLIEDDKPPSLLAEQQQTQQQNQQQQQHQEVKKNSMKLHSLDLSYNPGIDDRGVRALLELMKLCPNITDLKVDDCGPLSKTVLSKLDDKLRYNNSFLQKIGLSSDVSLAILDSVQLIQNESFNIFEATRNKAQGQHQVQVQQAANKVNVGGSSPSDGGNGSTSNRGGIGFGIGGGGGGGKERNKLGSYSNSTSSTRSSVSASMNNNMDNSPPLKRTAIPEHDDCIIEPDKPDKSSFFGSFLR